MTQEDFDKLTQEDIDTLDCYGNPDRVFAILNALWAEHARQPTRQEAPN